MHIYLATFILVLAIPLRIFAVEGDTGNADTGREKAAMCAGCHGADGNSTVPAYPKLAGMSEQYIVSQLTAFKEGRRSDPAMDNMVMTLSDQDMHDIGAYYEDQPLAGDAAPDEQAYQLALGEKLYFNGNAKTGMAACVGCHGQDGRGLSKEPSIPPIGGQHKEYVYKMLKSFNEGMRSNDREQMMRRIAERMSEEEMQALAAYVAYMNRL